MSDAPIDPTNDSVDVLTALVREVQDTLAEAERMHRQSRAHERRARRLVRDVRQAGRAPVGPAVVELQAARALVDRSTAQQRMLREMAQAITATAERFPARPEDADTLLDQLSGRVHRAIQRGRTPDPFG